MNRQEDKNSVLKGFSPVASQIYLEKQPNLSLFCKPLILPLKSPIIENNVLKTPILTLERVGLVIFSSGALIFLPLYLPPVIIIG